MKVLRSVLAVTIVAASFIGTAPAASAKSLEYCKFQTLQRGSWTDYEVKRTIVCMASKTGVDVSTALYVANRESGYEPRAWNSSSGAAGIFQHLIRYWPGRVDAYRKMLRRFDVNRAPWYNPRANIAVTMAMVRNTGWTPWSTY